MDGMEEVSASEIPDGFTADGSNNSQMAEREQQKQQILEQICDSGAYERLQRIKLVKKDKALQVELMLIQMAQNGSLQSKVTENKLIEMMEGVSEGKTKVVVARRNYGIDSDDDDNDDDLL
jgi:DNA-binding TFAR19-related protein (PDSD5 family)